MTRDVAVVGPNAPLSEVRRVFAQQPVHHVPVVSGDRLLGLISIVDLLSLWSNQAATSEADDRRARHIMQTRPTVVTARERTTIAEAAQMLSEGAFHALPVVDADDRLMGILTSTDLIRYLAQLLERASAR
jgi:CBS domain-containing protein